jgi:VWFA-related protein
LYVASGFSRTVGTQQPPPQPTFRTEANYVRVDVYPTKDGTPVGDLTQADFEVLESGAPQRIEQFERVVIRGKVPQDLRVEPNTVEQARQAAQNPRARVFIVFLDVGHVDVGGSHNIRAPLVDALNGLIGPDDLVAVMTPQMSALDLAFARRTTTIEGFLARYWTWGDRDRMTLTDPIEQKYEFCYGPQDQSAITHEMIDRRREKMTFDALADLVVHLRGLREERKAIVAITNGWLLYGPNANLARPLDNQVPSGPPIGIDPRNGRLSSRASNDPVAQSRADCDTDRSMLAQLDDRDQIRHLPDEANRANVSFYPVDPRGLAVFESPINNPLPLDVDARLLRTRSDSLRTLADNTDGIALVSSNDLAGGFRRIVDDLSSYYLLGYYSSGKLDGRFHPISVRVKRPGVKVRARRGYLAMTPAVATAAARNAAGRAPATTSGPVASEPKTATATAEAHAIEAAIAPLGGYARDVPLRLQLAAGWKPGNVTSAAIWIVGEIGGVAAIGDAWTDGFDATATLTTTADATVASGRVTVPRGGRTFRMALTSPAPLEPGEYVLRVGARASAGTASIPSRETARLTIPPAPESVGAIFVRRALATGNKDTPTADLRFRRNEQVRVEVPADSAESVSARLLDRTGKALAVPVTAGVRDDADGSRWQTAQLALAPLAPGDYVIEIASGNRKTMSAFRVIP